MNAALVTHYLTHYEKVKHILMQHKNLSEEGAEDCLHNLYFKCANTKANVDSKTLPQYFNRMVNNAAAEHIRAYGDRVVLGDAVDSVLANMATDYDLEDMYYNEEQKALLHKALPFLNITKRNGKKNIAKAKELLFGKVLDIKTSMPLVIKAPKSKAPYEKIKTKIDKSLLAKLLKTHSMDQIQKEYGWSKNTIIKYRKLYKLESRGRTRRLLIGTAAILKLVYT